MRPRDKSLSLTRYHRCLLSQLYETFLGWSFFLFGGLRVRRVAGGIRSLVNARDLQLECARVLHKTLLVPVLTYGNETMLWKEKERSRVRTV